MPSFLLKLYTIHYYIVKQTKTLDNTLKHVYTVECEAIEVDTPNEANHATNPLQAPLTFENC